MKGTMSMPMRNAVEFAPEPPYSHAHTHTSDSPVYRPKTPTRRWPPLSSDPFWILILFLDETYSRTNTQNKIDFTEWTKEWANKNNEKKLIK